MNDQSSHLATEHEPPPNWAALDRDILCPLCDYNLRGLVKPRCPECGHRSTWAELLDASTQKHPWLFEHQDRRRVRGFVQTLFRSQFPRTFWKGIDPVQRPRCLRLLIYWMVISSVLIAESAGPYLTHMGQRLWEIHQRRQQYDSLMRRAANTEVMYHGYWREMPWNIESTMHTLWRIAGHLCFILLLWPMLTFASLMLFRQTLRRARIWSGHLLRCAVYTMDPAIMLAWPLAFAMSACVDPLTDAVGGPVIFTPWVLVILLLLAGLFGYRLSCAYRYYLRFPAPVWMCVASQGIVLLALMAIMPWVIMF